jgi:hypothetical protein
MGRTLIVVLVGAILTLLLVSVGTYAVVKSTSAGQVISGQTTMSADPMKAVESSYYLFVFAVALPTVLIVGFLASFFSKRYQLVAAPLATAPVSIMASGFALRGVWMTLILVLVAIGAAYVATRSRKEQHVALASS